MNRITLGCLFILIIIELVVLLLIPIFYKISIWLLFGTLSMNRIKFAIEIIIQFILFSIILFKLIFQFFYFGKYWIAFIKKFKNQYGSFEKEKERHNSNMKPNMYAFYIYFNSCAVVDYILIIVLLSFTIF